MSVDIDPALGRAICSPLKRKRSFSESPTTSIPLDGPQLLLALPALLALPPTHAHHTASLRLSLLAIRRCLELKDISEACMTPELECRAWMAFVELSMKVVGSGLSGDGPESEEWARGLENEIGAAIGKGLAISQKHPTLHLYRHSLTMQHAYLAHWQHNHKFARALLRRHVASLSSTDPHTHHYETHLTLVSFALSSNPVDVPSALHSLSAIKALSERWGDSEVGLLSQVIKLRALVSALRWAEVFPLLDAIEPALGLTFPDVAKVFKPESQPKSQPPAVTPLSTKSLNTPESTPVQAVEVPVKIVVEPEQKFVAPPIARSELHAALEMHVLALGVVTYVQAGRSVDASKRITKLHIVLDSGVLDRKGIRDGVVEVPTQSSGVLHIPLYIHITHPRVFFHLAFLVSAVAMRDATGRRPKPKVFAGEGLTVCQGERPKEGQGGATGRYLPWASLRVRQDVEERLGKIEADLLCELISVCIQRSEFDEAEQHLARLIAHARTHQLWESYSARVTLYYGHLAHASSQTERALECYRVAAHLGGREEREGRRKVGGDNGKVHAGVAVAKFVRVAAQAGEIGLRIGMARQEGGGAGLDMTLKRRANEVARECRTLGGTLEAVGRVLEACLSEEIVVAKNNLKVSLTLTTHALDNHLRALVLALVSSHYLHTSTEYAEMMLTTAKQLAAGLGAPASKSQDPQFNTKVQNPPQEKEPVRKVGNAPLGLWVGERLLELYRRTGRDKRAKQQDAINTVLTRAVEGVEAWGKERELLATVDAQEEDEVRMEIDPGPVS